MDSKTEAMIIYALAEYRHAIGKRPGKVGSGGKIKVLSADERREVKAIVDSRLALDQQVTDREQRS